MQLFSDLCVQTIDIGKDSELEQDLVFPLGHFLGLRFAHSTLLGLVIIDLQELLKMH